MSFEQSKFATIGSQSTDSPKVYSYKTDDSLLVVTAADYFIDKRFQFDVGDIILASLSGNLNIVVIATTGAFGVTTSVAVAESPTKQVLVNQLSDFPDPVAEVITLADSIQYLLGSDINLGNNRLALGAGTVISGIESLVVTLTYTGTGDMFTGVDSRNRISNLTISCVNGRFINWSDTTGTILRLVDLSVSCDRVGLFNGTGSVIRFTNFSPATITTDGLEFTGDWLSVLYEVSLSNIAAGILFNLGTATFNSIILNTVTSTISAGATFLSGLVDSGNINTGGTGIVNTALTDGAGTVLNNISVDDALWEFAHNDDIPDTRTDGLLSLQGNAVATTIAVAGTPVLIAGAFVVERSSQMTGTTAGRLTYNGGKGAVLPITGSFTVEPVSGGAVDIGIEVSVDGVVVPNSKRIGNASAGNPTSITVPWQESLTTGKFVEFFVTNEDTTVNILVSSGTERVN